MFKGKAVLYLDWTTVSVKDALPNHPLQPTGFASG